MKVMKQFIANKLIQLARRIDPPNPRYQQFVMDQICEAMITGRSMVKISAVDPSEYYEATSAKPEGQKEG